MDEIFIHNSPVLVFRNSAMTQRKRPQLFIDAEARRIEDGATAEAGKAALEGKEQQIINHVETTRV